MSSQVTELRLPTWTLGDRCRKARLTLGLDQSDFAEALGVTRNTVGNYEADKTKAQRALLRAWASLCNVPYEWLVGDADVPFTKGRGDDRLPAGSWAVTERSFRHAALRQPYPESESHACQTQAA